MANIFSYLATYQNETFFDQVLNDIDILALTEISYLPFDGLIPKDFTPAQPMRLVDLAETFFSKYPEKKTDFMMTKNRCLLLEQMATSNRFKNIKVFGFVNVIDLEKELQFAAVVYQISRKEFLVIFRGTDDSIIGWKEDFNMTYMPLVPAQEAATSYLRALIEAVPGQFLVAGHSKGGNLAMYATSQITNQARLQAVVSFDAPGVYETVRNSEGFKALAGIRKHFIPQNSIIGLMLEIPEEAIVIKSDAFGLLQHSTFFWEIEANHFIQMEQVTQDSLQLDQTLKTWTASLTPQELQAFFDTLFGLILEAGIEKFDDIEIETPKKLLAIIENSQKLSEAERQMLRQISQLLIDTRIEVWKQNLKWPQLPSRDELRASLERLMRDKDKPGS